MSGGTGDADIYHRGGGWPTETVFDNAPQLVGNEETVTVPAPASGWHYIMLKPHTSSSTFSGVEVSASWQ